MPNPTNAQYVDKIEDLLREHNVSLPAGYSNHVLGIARDLVAEDNNSRDFSSVPATVRDYLSQHRLGQHYSALGRVVDALACWRVEFKQGLLRPAQPASQPAEATVDPTPTASGFDRQRAVDVITEFITTGSPHVNRIDAQGFAISDVTALLVLAGLVDERPEPVVDRGYVTRAEMDVLLGRVSDLERRR